MSPFTRSETASHDGEGDYVDDQGNSAGTSVTRASSLTSKDAKGGKSTNAFVAADEAIKEEIDVFANGSSEKGNVDFKGLTWPHAAVLVAKLQMGIGVIGIPGTFGTLGFVPGLISLLLLSAIGTYTGILCGQIRLLHPDIFSPAELGAVLFGGSQTLVELFGFFYWLFLVMTAGSAFLTSTVALNAVSEHAICTMGYLGVVVAASLLIGGGFRQLSKVAWLGWVGVISVSLAIWVLVIAMLTKHFPLTSIGQTGKVVVSAVNHKSTFLQAVSAVVTQVFALMGSIMFYSVSAEMRRPQDFSKAVLFGNAFVVLNYVCVGVIVYAKAGQHLESPALGSAGPLFKKICYGLSLPGVIISSIMFTHLAAKFVFVRALRGTRHLTTATWIHWTVWISSYTLVVALAFVLAAAIPIFDELLSLIGATTGSFFVFIVGGCISLYVLAHREGNAWRVEKATRVAETPCESVQPLEHLSTSANPRDAKRQRQATLARLKNQHRSTTSEWLRRSFDVAWRSSRSDYKSRLHFLGAVALIVAGGFLFITATWGTIKGIVDAYATGDVASAFACADNSNSSA